VPPKENFENMSIHVFFMSCKKLETMSFLRHCSTLTEKFGAFVNLNCSAKFS
jgi:hypothetical protein